MPAVSVVIMKTDTFAMNITVGVDHWLNVKRFMGGRIENMLVHDDLGTRMKGADDKYT